MKEHQISNRNSTVIGSVNMRFIASLIAALAAGIAVPSTMAASGNWNVNAAGTWSTVANWSSNPTVPGTAAGDTLGLTYDISAARTVTIDTTSRTVGTLNIGDPASSYFAYTLAASGGAGLTFNNSGSGAQLNKPTAANNVSDLISTPITLADNLTINISAAGTSTGDAMQISGVISGSGKNITLSAGGLQFSGQNTFSGGVTINGGDYQCRGSSTPTSGTVTSGPLGTGTVTINGGALSARNGQQTLANAISVNGDFTLTSAASGNSIVLTGPINLNGSTRTITVGYITVASTNFGVISNGGLTKAGAGSLALSGNNSYSGPTTVSAGALLVNGSLGSGAVTVSSGATLGGSGSIGGIVTVNAGGTLGTGTGNIGTLILSNTPILNGTVTAKINRNGGSPLADLIAVMNNPINYGGSLMVSNIGLSLQAGDTFTLFTASSHNGNFSNIIGTPGAGLTYSFTNGVLSVGSTNSSPTPAPYLTPSMSGSVFSIGISNLVPNQTCTLIGTDNLNTGVWQVASIISPPSSTAAWTTNANSSSMFYKIGLAKPDDAIRSGVAWYDNNGNTVSAHGAGIIKDNGLYYLFGEFHNDTNNAFSGFSCYSSPDLYHWTFENMALPVQASGRLGPNTVGERPKVMKCPKTGKYVMYMHTDNITYTGQAVGYATCDTVNGNYTFQGTLNQTNGSDIPYWDMGAFQDDDGSGYIMVNGGNIYKLGDDYTNVVSQPSSSGGSEAPAMFKKDGTYYFLASQSTGWERNDNYYYTATNISGPWTSKGDFAPAGTLTWNSQTTFVLPIVGSAATNYMFMGDRWSYPYQNSAATYVWQPLVVSNGTISLPNYKQSWNVATNTGLWYLSDILGNETIDYTDTNQITYSAGWTNQATDAFTDVSNATYSVNFVGSRIGIYGVARSNGGYARVQIQDTNSQTVFSTVFETYCLYTETSLKFLSPVLASGNYRLTVTVMGQHWSWTLKNGTVTGSTGNFVSVDKVVIKN